MTSVFLNLSIDGLFSKFKNCEGKNREKKKKKIVSSGGSLLFEVSFLFLLKLSLFSMFLLDS